MSIHQPISADTALDLPAIAAAAEKLASRTMWPERARNLRHIAEDARHAIETGDTASIDSVTEWLEGDADLEAAVSYSRSTVGMPS